MTTTPILNRTCKECGTAYNDPGGEVFSPGRSCPNCGSHAWYAGPDISWGAPPHPLDRPDMTY